MSEETRGTTAPDAEGVRNLLLSRSYQKLLLVSVLLGVPIAVACFFFVGLQHTLQHAVWESLPRALGHDRAPWWWPLPALLLAGLILAPIVTRMRGHGGHLPVNGLGGPPVGPAELPGAALAALATLPLGVVLGPEAPLMAVGSGLALLALRAARTAVDPRSALVIGTTGSTAAIATILGGPLVAAVLVVEAAGLAGGQLVLLLLPCLVASAVGALVFTGFGTWTGLSIGGLALPTLPPDVNPDAGDFLWGLPLAVIVAVIVGAGHQLGRITAVWTARSTATRTVACAFAAGICLTAYAVLTGRSPEEAALSGQATLGELAAHPHDWSVAALVALVACKGLAWGISLGSLRGGPIFPALLIGASAAMACSALPGFGVTPALALGLAAAAATVSGLPLTSAVLAVLLLGEDAYNQMPLIVLAAVIAHLTTQFVDRRTRDQPSAA
ncbi:MULTISPECIES: chloride channel protein [unclassified Streptomyces]|uniref:chloride channel protein n=1 Tax=unclassified Streptomyces TaxID=2593676 RepID=UPI0007004F37|nr:MULTISPECIES: chloride channel protein [unclassified Streptomyces]KQX50763.1 chloride channel core [Streptomyces sp. Root1304]KRA84928.1 chloride channel core [Streptomyces sp. Root66D1]